jgi:hypothetical protein
MADPTRKVDGGDDAAVRPRQRTTGLAPWQKVVGIIGLIVILLIVIVLISGGHTSPIQHGSP